MFHVCLETLSPYFGKRGFLPPDLSHSALTENFGDPSANTKVYNKGNLFEY